MEIIIRRASFRAEDFNSDPNCRQFGVARTLGNFITIEIRDHLIDSFKTTLYEIYSGLDADLKTVFNEMQKLEQLEQKQMMIRQVITKTFKPD